MDAPSYKSLLGKLMAAGSGLEPSAKARLIRVAPDLLDISNWDIPYQLQAEWLTIRRELSITWANWPGYGDKSRQTEEAAQALLERVHAVAQRVRKMREGEEAGREDA
jgi:hypothetical protein